MNTYKTRGVCSREIRFEIEDNKIKTVQFIGGCSGNTQGVSRLIEGMDVVNRIACTKTGSQDRPAEDQKMAKVTVETFGVDYPEPEKC